MIASKFYVPNMWDEELLLYNDGDGYGTSISNKTAIANLINHSRDQTIQRQPRMSWTFFSLSTSLPPPLSLFLSPSLYNFYYVMWNMFSSGFLISTLIHPNHKTDDTTWKCTHWNFITTNTISQQDVLEKRRVKRKNGKKWTGEWVWEAIVSVLFISFGTHKTKV